ncbi:MAG: CRP/FNR family transcriptional regulator [Roseivirga sp.]|jgi:CRP/FNR family transcriptional regulator
MNAGVEEFLIKTGLEEALVDEIITSGRLLKLSVDQSLMSSGESAAEMPIVIKGALRIMREDDHGNELFLYYLGGGEACAMSIRCCLSGKLSEFSAIAEEDSEVWMVPMSQLDHWMAKYKSFRKFVFDSYQDRFDELMNTIDSISFMKMDERLMKFLLDKKQSSGSYAIHKTHEQIAQELNTSRVVVSRLLKKLEREDKIELHRNRIEVL